MNSQDIRMRDFRLAGSWSGDEPGWDERRVQIYLRLFLVLGASLRLLRYGLKHPLWSDEAFLSVNILNRDFSGLMKPLDYQQVCPLLFLWVEKSVSLALGFSEWSLRLVPTIASIASLFLFRHVAGRLLKGQALVLAVAFLAVAFTPIRHGGEIKPYASDLLIALGLIALAIEWLRNTERSGSLWGLVVLGPLSLGFSNPAIFLVVGLWLVLATPVLKSRRLQAIIPFALFGLISACTFIWLLRAVNAPQSANVMEWMRVYWAGAFPPRSPIRLIFWLVRTHTSQMFAYPGGGDHGASTLTTVLVLVAIAAYWRRGSGTILALLLTPFALGLLAAALGRYPYGGSARTMQYVAPAILLMAGLGAAVLLGRVPCLNWKCLGSPIVINLLFVVGVGMMGWDVTHPYKIVSDQASREFAKRFWREEAADSELLCAKTDLHLRLSQLAWQGNRAAMYLCNQAIYSPMRLDSPASRFELVHESRPLRLVVFGETPEDFLVVSRWMAEYRSRFELRSRKRLVVNKGVILGRVSVEELYVVYEFTPQLLVEKPWNRARR
jgi:hypothetical protein